MSKDEFLKIQTCVLKVNIHCDGCKHKVKKILQKIEGVYTTKIDAEQGKVTVSGNIDANTLIKKLIKNGKHAEIWGAKPNNNSQNHLNQFKNLQISNGGKGGGGNNKGQGQKGGGNHPQQGGGGGGGPQGQNPHLQQIQQQMKGFQDMKMLPQFMKDMKLPPNNGKDQNSKAVKFKLPEDDDLSDDDYDDDDYDDDEFDDDDLDDEMDDAPLNKMKPMVGNGHGGSQMQNMMNGQLPQHLKPGGNGGNNGGNGKKGGGGGGGNVPVHINHGGGGSGGGGGGSGKKGGNGGGNPNQGGGAKGGKNGGGGGQNKNGGGPANGNPFMANGAKKGNDGPHGMPNMMMSNGGNMGQHMGNLAQMGHMSNLPMGQMSNLAAVQGLPASGMAGGGPGYGGGADHMQGNPYYQQQLAAMMMNQQRANGNERFQPMMYARPPPAVNYMPPYPPYPYPPPPGERADQYSMFSDENTSSCSMM